MDHLRAKVVILEDDGNHVLDASALVVHAHLTLLFGCCLERCN